MLEGGGGGYRRFQTQSVGRLEFNELFPQHHLVVVLYRERARPRPSLLRQVGASVISVPPVAIGSSEKVTRQSHLSRGRGENVTLDPLSQFSALDGSNFGQQMPGGWRVVYCAAGVCLVYLCF